MLMYLHRVLTAIRAERGMEPVIEVDGGENMETGARAAAAGTTAIVAGSAIFGGKDHKAAIAAIRRGSLSAWGAP
jgi:ribulose-phosphate 3-epimerase